MRKNSVKSRRINGEVRRELENIIRNEVKDPRISPMTSVLEAEVTVDLKYCKAYISVLGTDEEVKDTMDGLNSAVGFIRSCLAKNVNLRNTPELIFIPDRSIEHGVRMTQMIDEVVSQIPVRSPEEEEALERLVNPDAFADEYDEDDEDYFGEEEETDEENE